MASRTLPALKSSFGFTGTVCLLARRLPRLQLENVKSLVDEALERSGLFWVVADLDLAIGKGNRLHRIFTRTRVLDRRDQSVFQMDLVVILLVVAHRLVINDVDSFQIIADRKSTSELQSLRHLVCR